MSDELEKARDLFERGKHKKALGALWAVEARARTNLDEAQGLVDLATSLRDHLSGRTLNDCDRVLRLGLLSASRLASDPRTGALAVVPECRCLGGSGLGIEPSDTIRWDLIFHQEEVRLTHRDRLVRIRYSDITTLEVGEPAVGDTGRDKAKAAAVRVGTTAAVGFVMLPVALPLLFVKGGHSTGFALRTNAAELFLLHRSDTRPEEWRLRLSEVFVRFRERSGVSDEPSHVAARDDRLVKLERLASLRAQGVISDQEMEQLKADLLVAE